jgi:hypothetical protein
MKPSEIDYSSQAKHYIDLSNGEVLAGVRQLAEYRAREPERDTIHAIGSLLRLPVSDTENVGLERLDTSDWTPERFKQYAFWIKRVVDPPDEGKRHLSMDVFCNARNLGLGPGKDTIKTAFGSFSKLYTEMRITDVHIMGNFDEWDIDDFVAHVRRIGGDRRPTAEQITAAGKKDRTKPQAAFIRARFEKIGGLSKILELAGYPVISTWEKDDYIDWGVKFMQANDGMIPTSRMMDYLSTKKIGPSGSSARSKFIKMRTFQAEVGDAYEQVVATEQGARREKLMMIDEDLQKGNTPIEVFISGLSEAEQIRARQGGNHTRTVAYLKNLMGEQTMIRRYAKYRVVTAISGQMGQEARISLVNESETMRGFVPAIRKHSDVTPGEIEHTALILGFFDDIWPMDQHLKTLKLDSGYAEYYQRLETARKAGKARKHKNDRGVMVRS